MISVITPVFNNEKYIESCILDVINQRCSLVEHIIVDGGSSDKTLDVIKHYAVRYPHIRWISEKDNGQSHAMNKGIQMAKGSIIGFLNVDDYYEPTTLNTVIEIFKNLPKNSFLVGNCKVWSEKNEILFVNKPVNISLYNIYKDLTNFPHNPSAYFYHASLHKLVGMYDEQDHYVMDFDFIMRVVQRAYLKYIDIDFGNYRVIPGAKSFEDAKAGNTVGRQQAILEKYRKNLSLTERLQLQYFTLTKGGSIFMAKPGTRKIIYFFNTCKYYLLHPNKFYRYFNERFFDRL
ncbi:glycosyltransferase family 2 protein [Rhodocytophaga aerolata]|uniref:Glycosyltransferase family 2 protein n=1 Tax=Rhodocytophaga aerolata TaxID=455078 RepID=A0ABT8RFX0_9BACT|nr:glycosyltransferase family 2 protein [Rhodocytophaga aerolata]MDO1451012.1 glycosyltransferase family 2 protein [Rhodocytophaga aerolata]